MNKHELTTLIEAGIDEVGLRLMEVSEKLLARAARSAHNKAEAVRAAGYRPGAGNKLFKLENQQYRFEAAVRNKAWKNPAARPISHGGDHPDDVPRRGAGIKLYQAMLAGGALGAGALMAARRRLKAAKAAAPVVAAAKRGLSRNAKIGLGVGAGALGVAAMRRRKKEQ